MCLTESAQKKGLDMLVMVHRLYSLQTSEVDGDVEYILSWSAKIWRHHVLQIIIVIVILKD